MRPAASAEEDAVCGSGTFRSGQENFVLDAEDAVKAGAAMVATAHVQLEEECERACCEDSRCNLALLEPRVNGNCTCVLFNCVHRNRFVCRFVNKVGYRSYIRNSVYLKHLQGPRGESTTTWTEYWININIYQYQYQSVFYSRSTL